MYSYQVANQDATHPYSQWDYMAWYLTEPYKSVIPNRGSAVPWRTANTS